MYQIHLHTLIAIFFFFFFKAYFLEVYNEELDFLIPIPTAGERLQIFDDPVKKIGVNVKGLFTTKTKPTKSWKEVQQKELLQLLM